MTVKVYTVIPFVQGLENPCYTLSRNTQMTPFTSDLPVVVHGGQPHKNLGRVAGEMGREIGLRWGYKSGLNPGFTSRKKIWQDV